MLRLIDKNNKQTQRKCFSVANLVCCNCYARNRTLRHHL
nr:MAG TPA: hypothetical protein [Bacteriophage sp.]